MDKKKVNTGIREVEKSGKVRKRWKVERKGRRQREIRGREIGEVAEGRDGEEEERLMQKEERRKEKAVGEEKD